MKSTLAISAVSFLAGAASVGGYVALTTNFDALSVYPHEYRRLTTSLVINTQDKKSLLLPVGTVLLHERTYLDEAFAVVPIIISVPALEKASVIIPASEGANQYWAQEQKAHGF